MRRLRLSALVLCLATLAQPGQAQMSLGEPVAGPTPILMLDQNRLYTNSRFGQKMLAETDAAAKALAAENRAIEAALEAEETALAERRASLPPAEFQKLAQAFDARVRDIRRDRDAKVRDIAAQQEQSQRAFLEKVGPVLAQILIEMEADLILDRSAIILSSSRIDITDLAIARIDASLMPPANPAPAEPEAQTPSGNE
jgi:Skp family chaperone for outer membrane proteins